MNKRVVDSLMKEQRQRWQKGDAVRAESYLESCPSLRANKNDLLDLIYNEMLLRQDSGETPDLNEYLARFPHLADDLQLLCVAHTTFFGSTGRPTEAQQSADISMWDGTDED